MSLNYHYQKEVAEFVAEKAQGGHDTIGVVLPTGAGKSYSMRLALRAVKEMGFSMLVLVPQNHIKGSFLADPLPHDDSDTLFEAPKSSADLVRWMQEGGAPGAVTTHAAFRSLMQNDIDADCFEKLIVVCDEGHHFECKDDGHQNTESLELARKLGATALVLTASPARHDSKGMKPIFADHVPVYERSFATHIDEGYSPSNISIHHIEAPGYKATSAAELDGAKGIMLSKKELRDYAVWVADLWEKTGRMKCGHALPLDGSGGAVADAIEAELVSRGARVLNVVGAGKHLQTKLMKELDRERELDAYSKSTIDVILAGRRLDEGTDWKFCRAMFVHGLVRNLIRCQQLLGRCTRLDRIGDHPHSDEVRVFFLVPQIEDADAELQELSEKVYIEHQVVMGAWLASVHHVCDHLELPFRSLVKKAKSRPKSTEVIFDTNTADVVADFDFSELQKMIMANPSAESVLASIQRHAEDHKWSDGRVQQMLNTLVNMPSDEVPAPVKDLIREFEGVEFLDDDGIELGGSGQNTERPKKKRGEKSVSTERMLMRDSWELLDLLQEECEGRGELEFKTCSAVREYCLRMGKGTAARLAHAFSSNLLTKGMIIEAMKAFFADHGRWPNVKSGDASRYFGFHTTWMAVNDALKQGYRGLPGGSSLKQLRIEAGLGVLSEAMIIKAQKAFFADHGRWPNEKSGGASRYFGFQIKWKAVYKALTNGSRGLPGGSSLKKLRIEAGLETEAVLLSKAMIIEAQKAFFADHGRYPGQKDGDGSRYFGFQIKWPAVEQALKQGCRGLAGGSSLKKLRIEAGLGVLSKAMIIEAQKAFFADHGRYPGQKDGDGSRYFGFQITWTAINAALSVGLRGLPGGSSLVKLRKSHGL
jgi:superfamily II DNA or RNA helicase